MATNKAVNINWDYGTGYDFLASLHVLHFPDEFGLRGAWAAGVRSRLPSKAKEFLELIVGNFNPPLHWVYSLPAPKDAATVLLALKQIPAADRLPALQLSPVNSPEAYALLLETMESGSWDQADTTEMVRIWRNAGEDQYKMPGPVTVERAEKIFEVYADPAEFGRRYLDALQAYYEVFFSEEEKRIGGKMEQALAKTQQQVSKVGAQEYLDSLAENLKGGFRAGDGEVILTPSYWCSPGVAFSSLETNQSLLMFGARPKEESLVPGEIVPEDLLQRLKAMTDPTRMRILRYLLQEQLTPAELARRLRLRAPTVTHHLHTLKKAGMVHFVKKGKNEHLYYAKMDSIKETYVLLKDFLEQDVNLVEGLGLFDNDPL
ncbi:MAG: metalloregulator ArsR/SmtB family transcription factor [Anaerolineales bacterium]|jgi:DNA-binding transcriptional ArsR family regulator